MSKVSFPNNPQEGDFYTVNNILYQYTNQRWKNVSIGSLLSSVTSYINNAVDIAKQVHISETAPASPSLGSLWWSTTDHRLKIYYNNLWNNATSLVSLATQATTLETGRTIGITGDITYTSPSFDGSQDVTSTATLSNSGVNAGTYVEVTVDAKGRVTQGRTGSIITVSGSEPTNPSIGDLWINI